MSVVERRHRRVAVPLVCGFLLAVSALPSLAGPAPEGGAPGFSADYVSTTLGGGEPYVVYSHGTGNLVYSAHEGTTHIDKNYLTTPGSSCDLQTQSGFLCSYDNQVNIWYSTDRGKSWTKSPGNPAYTGFSDPSLTEDAGNNVYDTGINLANDAVYASSDGGKTWSAGTAQCHEGDRPWLAGGEAGEVFMSTDTEEGGHEVFRGTLAGGTITCSSSGVPDSGGQGQLYYDHGNGAIVEGVAFPDGGYGIGVLAHASHADFSGGNTTPFVRSEGIDCKRYAAYCSNLGPLAPEIAIDAHDTVYVVWATNPRDDAGKLGCSDFVPNANGGATLLQNQVVMVYTTDLGKTWSTPKVVAAPTVDPDVVTPGPFDGHTVLWPWVTAGAPGNVSVAYYEADQLTDPDCDSANLAGREPSAWTLRVADVFHATDPKTHYPPASVNAVPNFDGNHPGGVFHRGGVCQSGTTCAATGQDRRLGDLFTSSLDQNGCLMIATADTQLVDATTGAAATSQEYSTGRPLFLHQTSGRSLTDGHDCGHVPDADH